MELFTETTGETAEVDAQLLVHAAELSQLDYERLIDLKKSQMFEVGSEGIGEHKGISLIVFGSGGAVTVSEAVELLGIDPANGEAALQQTLDERSPAQFDRDRDQRRFGAQLEQASSKCVHAFGTVVDREVDQFFPLGIEDTDHMRVAGPVDTREQTIASFHTSSPPDCECRTAAVLHRPCTGALGATPHGMYTSGLPAGTLVHPWRSKRSGPVWRSRRVAGSHIISDGENGTGAPAH